MNMIKILIAEHDATDLEMIQHELLKGGIKHITEIVQNEPGFINALETFIPDIILSDYTFPSFNGARAFSIKEKICPDTPFIVVSGTIGEENSIELIKNGVTDFVLKDKIFTLNTKLVRALKDAEDKKQKDKTDKELAQSETHLAEAQRLAKMGSWDFDIESDRLTWSKELYNVFGVDNKKFNETHGSFVNLVDEEDRLLVQQTSRNTQLTGDPFTLEYHITTLLGEKRVIREQGYGKKDETGKIARLFGTAQDITHLKETELLLQKLNEDLEKRAQELQDSNLELERFAYVASHDLQEPLRMVSSFLQLLEKKYKGHLDSTADQYIQFAVDGASRMKKLIQDLLDYSKAGSNKEIEGITDMNEVVQEVLAVFSVRIEEQEAIITTGPMPVLQHARKTQLFQLMQNLVGNALKFHGVEKPIIQINAQENETHWIFTVQDNGIGFDIKYAEKIFVLFQRLHSIGSFSGTGIGLSICKKIVERHNGSIWVESEPGKGSTFYFTVLKK